MFEHFDALQTPRTAQCFDGPCEHPAVERRQPPRTEKVGFTMVGVSGDETVYERHSAAARGGVPDLAILTEMTERHHPVIESCAAPRTRLGAKDENFPEHLLVSADKKSPGPVRRTSGATVPAVIAVLRGSGRAHAGERGPSLRPLQRASPADPPAIT